MTHPLGEATATPAPSPTVLSVKSSRARRWERAQFGICLTVTLGVLVCLLWPAGKQAAIAPRAHAADQEGPVQRTSSGQIRIVSDSPLNKKLQIVTVRPLRIAAAALTVTGNVVASLRPGKGGGRDWQFSSPELLTTYTDWQKAIADIAFTKAQVDSIRKLAINRVAAQEALVARLRKLVEAGTDTERELVAAQTELLQAEIAGRKDQHEAETAARLAQRSEGALRRQLEQAGVDPELLRSTAEIDIVVADVPEVLLSRVKLGQSCEARFFGVGARRFAGAVRSISPVLSKERRTLRVLFTIDDPDDVLRPGMFAEIGLGTDTREALLVPLAGVVHVGRLDYLLVRSAAGDWRVTPVQVGETYDAQVEILDGLKAGDEVIAQGAILLKPVMVEVVRTSSQPIGSGL